MVDETLEELYQEAMKIKEAVFKLQDKMYPVTNKNIANLNDTMTFIRLLNHIRGNLETIGSCLSYTIRKDKYYFIQHCPKCFDHTFHRDNGKKTTHCVVCWKRNSKDPDKKERIKNDPKN